MSKRLKPTSKVCFFSCGFYLCQYRSFSLIDALILQRLPVRDPERLVQLFEIHPRIPACCVISSKYYGFAEAAEPAK
jgi:hypothetical protein